MAIFSPFGTTFGAGTTGQAGFAAADTRRRRAEAVAAAKAAAMYGLERKRLKSKEDMFSREMGFRERQADRGSYEKGLDRAAGKERFSAELGERRASRTQRGALAREGRAFMEHESSLDRELKKNKQYFEQESAKAKADLEERRFQGKITQDEFNRLRLKQLDKFTRDFQLREQDLRRSAPGRRIATLKADMLERALGQGRAPGYPGVQPVKFSTRSVGGQAAAPEGSDIRIGPSGRTAPEGSDIRIGPSGRTAPEAPPVEGPAGAGDGFSFSGADKRNILFGLMGLKPPDDKAAIGERQRKEGRIAFVAKMYSDAISRGVSPDNAMLQARKAGALFDEGGLRGLEQQPSRPNEFTGPIVKLPEGFQQELADAGENPIKLADVMKKYLPTLTVEEKKEVVRQFKLITGQDPGAVASDFLQGITPGDEEVAKIGYLKSLYRPDLALRYGLGEFPFHITRSQSVEDAKKRAAVLSQYSPVLELAKWRAGQPAPQGLRALGGGQ